MPGTDLGLELPSLSDTLADVVSKTATALEAIAADLEPRITAGELDISTELSLGGAPATNVGGIRLTGGATAVVGSIYEADGDFFLVTDAGVVQLTADGGIKVAAAGIIGGDYGGANPATVTFDDGDHAYDFNDEPGEYADVRCRSVVLHNNDSGGVVTISVDPAITTEREISVKTLPASGVSALVYSAATSTLETADTARITADLKATNVDASGTLAATGTATLGAALTVGGTATVTGTLTASGAATVAGVLTASGGFKHGVFDVVLPATSAHLRPDVIDPTTGYVTKTLDAVHVTNYGPSATRYFDIPIPCRIGERVTNISCKFYRSPSVPRDRTLALYRVNGLTITLVDFVTDTLHLAFPVTLNKAITTAVAAAGDVFFITVAEDVSSVSTGETTWYDFRVSYDAP